MSRKNYIRKLNIAAGIFGGLFIIMKAVAEKRKEGKDINDENPYLTESYFRTEGNQVEVDNYITGTRISNTSLSLYERILKPTIDRLLSFLGLVLLAPVFAMISAAIFLDDPGPIFFTQKRVGKDKEFFFLHKFRSMKMSTPHDVPTHQLSDPEQYITRVGRVLRKTSLDELPQIWDIFRGRMSIIGPRPALWNQDDLIRERDRYFANSVTPGLTGWAQINGRDELEIPDKAKLDGEYVKHLRQGGMKALFFDLKCFLGTVLSVAGGDGIVEGGTGEIHKIKAANQNNGRIKKRKTDSLAEYGAEEICIDDVGFEDYAYKKKFEINTSAENRKRVLITGANSYIGESFEVYARENYGKNFTIDTVDMIDGTWREKDLREYDCVFHVAGIAHADVGNVDEETKARYYAVNTDLAVETARKAKAEGVRQFVFMSSMIIYGEAAPLGKRKVIDEHTLPAPANFYGDSKWQADKLVRRLKNENFHVAVLRPPMIYGKGSKGNYPLLSKIAKNVPAFPAVNNLRSILHIDNLCEFLCLLMLSGEDGIYFPQNNEYAETASMVEGIADMAWHPIKVTRLLNPAVTAASHMAGKISGMVNKAFGNSIYSQTLSVYSGLDYQVNDFQKSIELTEADIESTADREIKKGA